MKLFIFTFLLIVSMVVHATDPTITYTQDKEWYSNAGNVTIVNGDEKVLLLKSRYRGMDDIIVLSPHQTVVYRQIGYTQYRILDKDFKVLIEKSVD